MLKNDFGNITIYLNRKYSIILSKIRIATYTANHISITVQSKEIQLLSIDNTPVYLGSMENNIFHGKGTLYNDEGRPKYEGTFQKGKFISGKVFGYYDNGEILYEIEYEEDIKKHGIMYKRSEIDHKIPYYFNGKFVGNHISDGITMEFHNNHAIKYEGSIQNEEYQGYGILYNSNGSVRYRGDFGQGEKINGELFGKDGYYFIGIFSNGLPCTGDVKNLSNHFVQNFTGSIVNGKPHTGEGLVFNRDQDGYDRHQHEVQDEIDYFEEEQYYREQEEWQQEQINQSSREEYERWDEYIKAKWNNGNIKEYEDKEINKRVYIYTNSQKKK
ncbi:hypothetical protein [Paenibacillus sp. HGF7]|uniref:hypothetical protein n=2 Tax=unclassified Paenibacillus TaxID=185978 RepID=UPI00020D6B21|nr:hypothetical protein [Paenibacillus sp. HGF7]EGL20169.1 MORN repeat protein [Paenibacillus sp. HGF7]